MILETNLPTKRTAFGSTFRWVTVAVCAVLGVVPATLGAGEGGYRGTRKDRGTVFDLTVQSAADPAAPLMEAQPAQFTLALRDETTGAKRSGVFPSIWMVLNAVSAEPDHTKRCTAQVARLLTGGFTSPSALDLNVYYVIALNGDGSITITDPHFGFGGSQLLAMLELGHTGYDWVLASGGNRLFVTVPRGRHRHRALEGDRQHRCRSEPSAHRGRP
jgi:hypothetical protein